MPKDVPLEMLGPMGCGFQTGAGAVMNSLHPIVGSSIAIFGVGSVGLAAIMGAILCGCSKIIAVDIVPGRLKLAEAFGTTYTVNAKESDPVKRIREITGFGADYTLECASNPLTFRQAVYSSAPQWGECGLIGVAATGTEASLDMGAILSGRKIRGILEGDSVPDIFIPQLIEFYRAGRFPFDRLLRFYPME